MEFRIDGNPDYGSVSVRLGPGEMLQTESGAMSWMSVGLELESKVLGGALRGLARKFLGGESFFVGEYGGSRGGELTISPSEPGTVLHRRLDGDTLLLTAGSFLACTPGIDLRTRFGGFRALFSGEGAFLLVAEGSGDLFFNAYGGVVERQVEGSLRVDTGHLVAFEPTLEYRIAGMGGIKQTLLSGEGLVMEFTGHGRIYLQTRTMPATAGWLAPFCIG